MSKLSPTGGGQRPLRSTSCGFITPRPPGRTHFYASFRETDLILDHSAPRGTAPRERVPNTPLLGVCRGLAVYLLFNGILGDKSSNGGNVLTRKTLAKLPPFAGPKVIYCAGCLIGAERLAEEGITVRQTPYEIRVS